MSFQPPDGKQQSTAMSAVVPASPTDVDDVEYPMGLISEPMPLPPDFLLELAKKIFWVGGIAIGNGGQCITSIVALMLLQYSNPVLFLSGLEANLSAHGLGFVAVLCMIAEVLVRLIVCTAIAVVFQFGMALVIINTTGTWGNMLYTHAPQLINKGKRQFSFIVGTLLLFEGVVAVGDILSDSQAANALTHDLRFIIIFTSVFSFATLILTPVSWMLKKYAEYKLEEINVLAEAYGQQNIVTEQATQ